MRPAQTCLKFNNSLLTQPPSTSQRRIKFGIFALFRPQVRVCVFISQLDIKNKRLNTNIQRRVTLLITNQM